LNAKSKNESQRAANASAYHLLVACHFMFNSITKLFGRSPNPTAEWPPQSKRELVYDLRSCSVNGLKLGGAFNDARPFGQCDDFTRSDKFLDLFYRQSGLSLEFASDQLIGVDFVVGRDSFQVKEHKMGVSFPAIIDGDGQRHVLTDSSTLQDLTSCFGKPVESAPAGDDMVHSFMILKNFVESYHNRNSCKLLYLEICETNDA
jgi:hypothetical protein